MPFRVKDLMIDVVALQPCPAHTLTLCHFHCTKLISFCQLGCTWISCHQFVSHCFTGTINTCHLFCSNIGSQCGPISNCPGGSICPGGSGCPGGSVIDPTLLDPGVIRERLKQQLAAAEALEQAEAEAMRPQTMEQVDMLEGKLKEALAELARRREELKKGAGK